MLPGNLACILYPVIMGQGPERTPVCVKVKMSSPLTLQMLARSSLLKNEALAISALNKLPMELFPPLFKDAFKGKQTKILSAMVAAWPFRCLPLGALMKFPDLEILKAVLAGLDLLIQQKDRPRNCKLEVLDFRDAHHNFWNVWAGTEDGVCSPDVIGETQPVVHHPERQGKEVVTSLFHRPEKSLSVLHETS
ncbi:Gm13023 [Phodopus roborovskii]|uniref:Gm13023 protein n=1 Tax=Phodopus roborovskii TaxID=109678 RepID=A0AAV0AEW0_PHORO|nr:Gm13023 [Phodopus roborovskii]